MEKKGIHFKDINVMKDMCGLLVVTSARTMVSDIEEFPFTVGLHHKLPSSPYL